MDQRQLRRACRSQGPPGKDPKPNDIDVVTFYHQPDDQPPEFHDLLRPSIVRDRYNIDAFNLGMGTPTTNHLAESVAYWYGMWSTRREYQMPKGFVQVNLDPQGNRVLMGFLEMR